MTTVKIQGKPYHPTLFNGSCKNTHTGTDTDTVSFPPFPSPGLLHPSIHTHIYIYTHTAQHITPHTPHTSSHLTTNASNSLLLFTLFVCTNSCNNNIGINLFEFFSFFFLFLIFSGLVSERVSTFRCVAVASYWGQIKGRDGKAFTSCAVHRLSYLDSWIGIKQAVEWVMYWILYLKY
jgi:hypothetical protein